MLSFHNDPKIKEKYIARVEAHYKADEIVKGKYWEDGKGCAVGCTLHSSLHIQYEKELGIPIQLAYFEDTIFENLPNAEAKEFPLQFLQAIPVGADLNPVWKKLLIWNLTDKDAGLIKYVTDKVAKKVIQDISDLFVQSLTREILTSEIDTLRIAARAARAALAALDARAARSARAALDALDALAAFAALAAFGAFDALDARAALAALAAFAAQYILTRDKLLELLRESGN